MELKIEYVPTKDLVPYEKNTRKHEDYDVGEIAKSIQKYGFNDPIGVWKDNIIIEGHGRLLAAKKLGMKEVPIIRLDHLTDEERREYAIMHNKTAELSNWDFPMLEEEFAELDGLNDFDINFEIYDNEQDEIIEVTEDDYDAELPKEPKSKLGDIWQLGNHRLMCGDSTILNDVEKLLGGERANIVFTDPPYGCNYQSNMREKSAKFGVIENDDKILDFFPNINIVCDGFIFICTTWKVLDKWLPLFKQYYDLTNMIIWNKGGGCIGDLKHTFSTDYEIILCSNNGKELKGKRIGSVWDVAKNSANEYIHPTQKPVELSALAIKQTTDVGNVVLDLFGGSGSTLIACEQLKRKAYLMEFDPKYVDAIIDRWEQFTGEKAVLLNEHG